MKLVKKLFASLHESLGIHTADQLYELFTSQQHGIPLQSHRAHILQNRIYFFCSIFAVLVPAWSLVDLLFFPGGVWRNLLLLRLLTGLVFAAIAWQARKEPGIARARKLLMGMLAATAFFHLVTASWLQTDQLGAAAQVLAQLYTLLPFVMVAGLALFPLTLKEIIFFAVPMYLVILISVYTGSQDLPQAVSTLWLSAMILGVAIFSALSQLRYMLSQVSRASYDALTGTLTRRAGIEVLDLQFRLAAMHEAPLSILYCDLDNFKTINDTFGHGVGDNVLSKVARQIEKAIRKGDSVIRWGGEEFVVVLPAADPKEAERVVGRVISNGIGQRPDGGPVTASIGVAEVREDRLKNWKAQIELADVRMYSAKNAGRARCCGVTGEPLIWADYVRPERTVPISLTDTANDVKRSFQRSLAGEGQC